MTGTKIATKIKLMTVFFIINATIKLHTAVIKCARSR